MRTSTRVLLIIGLALGLAAAVLLAFTRPTFGDPNDIDHWKGTTTQSSPVYETKSVQVVPKEYVVHTWKRHISQTTPSRQAVVRTETTTTDIWCARTQRNVTGYNAVGVRLAWGTLSIHQCWGYLNGKITNRFYDWSVQTWCDGLTGALYNCEGGQAETVVQGSGLSNKPGHIGVLYRYRRATFHFTQGLPNVATLNYHAFASLTVRADGSYEGDAG